MDIEGIYDEHFDLVWRTLQRFGVSEHEREDAAQDVFLIVHRKADSFEERSTVKTWLYGISRRVAKDYRRRNTRKPPPKVPLDELATLRPSPRQEAARREAAELVEAIVSQFHEDSREIFLMTFFDDMTVPEIAMALNLNLNTVYTKLRRAKAKFEQECASLNSKEVNVG